MGTNLEHREERVTYARVHAVLAGTSVIMIGQITSANPITPQLRTAVWFFGASLLLNTLFYVLETDPYAPRYKSKLMFAVFSSLHSAAICVILIAMTNVIQHFSVLASFLFELFGGFLWLYLSIVLSKNRWILLNSQLDAYEREADEFGRQADDGMRQMEEIKRGYDEQVQQQTTAESAAGLARQQQIAGRLEEKAAELKRLVAKHTAVLDTRKAELDRLTREVHMLMPRVVQPSKD